MINIFTDFDNFYQATNVTKDVFLDDVPFILKVEGLSIFLGIKNREDNRCDNLIETLIKIGYLEIIYNKTKLKYFFMSYSFVGGMVYDYKILCSSVLILPEENDIPASTKSFILQSKDIDQFILDKEIQYKLEEKLEVEIKGKFNYSTYGKPIFYEFEIERMYKHNTNPNYYFRALCYLSFDYNMSMEKVMAFYHNFMRCFSFANRKLNSNLDSLVLDAEKNIVVYFTPDHAKYKDSIATSYRFTLSDIKGSFGTYLGYLSSAKKYHEYSVFALNKSTFDIYDLLKISSGFEFYFDKTKINKMLKKICANRMAVEAIKLSIDNDTLEQTKQYLSQNSKPTLREKLGKAFEFYKDKDNYNGIGSFLRFHLVNSNEDEIISRIVKARNNTAHGTETSMTKTLLFDTAFLEYIVFRLVLDLIGISNDEIDTIL